MNKLRTMITILVVFTLITQIQASQIQVEHDQSKLLNEYSTLINESVNEMLEIRKLKEGWTDRVHGQYFNLSATVYKQKDIYLKKIVGIIPVSFEKVVKYYSEVFDNTEFTRNTMCGSQKLIEKLDENTLITFYKGEGNILASSREHLSIQSKNKLTDNEILITRTTLPSYHGISEDQSAIRMNGLYGIFIKNIGEERTEFESYYLFDIGGYVPLFLVNLMSDKHLDVLENDIPFIQRL